MKSIAGCASPNTYSANHYMTQLYNTLDGKFVGLISVISTLYGIEWSNMSLSDDELYSLLTVSTHIIIRYVREKETEHKSRGIEIFKHVVPDQLLRVWYFAYTSLNMRLQESDADVAGIDLTNWIQVLWLNNFCLQNNNMDINTLSPIFMLDVEIVGDTQDKDFIRKLIYLEASHRMTSPAICEKRKDCANYMLPQQYDKLVVEPYKAMNSINLRKFPEIEAIIQTFTLDPRVEELQCKFSNSIPVQNFEHLHINIDQLPAVME